MKIHWFKIDNTDTFFLLDRVQKYLTVSKNYCTEARQHFIIKVLLFSIFVIIIFSIIIIYLLVYLFIYFFVYFFMYCAC